MKQQMLAFGRALRANADIGLFYYAGHAVQVGGNNYLIPVDANIADESEVSLAAVNVNEFLATMSEAKSRVKIVVLDACRNNPFPSASRSATRGLAIVRAPTGTLIAYSTSPDEVALDGDGDLSPYAQALTTALETEVGKPIELVFRKARNDVLEATGGQQTPWDLSSITGDVVLAGTAPAGEAVASEAAASKATGSSDIDGTAEITFWNSISTSTNAAFYDAYLQQYPNGRFTALARAKIDEIKQGEIARQSAVEAERDVKAAEAAAQDKSQKTASLASRSWLLPWTSRRPIRKGDLAAFGCDQLWVARNEIFARQGYCFSTPRGRQVFGTDGCTTSSQDILSPLEKRNVQVIQLVEKSRGCQ